ncbi:MAG: flagellar export chaperone FliS [Alphaproteobacteria bacterium]|nr:flagellar export chaperone FliS [Alphaproteobacteria bacterium]
MYTDINLEEIEEVNAAFPSHLIVVLYDEAIASLMASIQAIGDGDIEARFNATSHTAEVISQLYLALDMETGGEIAENLGAIYNHIITQLPRINFANDQQVAEQAIKLLRPIRDSWFELDERIRSTVENAEAEDMADVAAALVAKEAMAAQPTL